MLKVLVVDDDFRVAHVHGKLVSQLPGFTVVDVVNTASAAMSVLRQGREVDLVLLDNYLPDLSGLELLRRLGGSVDVMMVTADTAAQTVRAARAAGALNFIIKPFVPSVLHARLRAYEKYRARLTSGELRQDQVDHVYAVLNEGNILPTPKGQSAMTAQLVRNVLADGREMTAVEVASAAGISRPTAQRYLAALADEGKIVMSLRYGSTGRPEHRYSAPE